MNVTIYDVAREANVSMAQKELDVSFQLKCVIGPVKRKG